MNAITRRFQNVDWKAEIKAGLIALVTIMLCALIGTSLRSHMYGNSTFSAGSYAAGSGAVESSK